jgi:hypothetical protein
MLNAWTKSYGRIRKSISKLSRAKRIGTNTYEGLIKPSKASSADAAFAENIKPAVRVCGYI